MRYVISSSCSTHQCERANEKDGVENEDGDDDKKHFRKPERDRRSVLKDTIGWLVTMTSCLKETLQLPLLPLLPMPTLQRNIKTNQPKLTRTQIKTDQIVDSPIPRFS